MLFRSVCADVFEVIMQPSSTRNINLLWSLIIAFHTIDKMIFEVNELYENGKLSKEEEIKFENWRYNVKEFI